MGAVLSVVIPVGTSPKEPNWLLVTLIPIGLLGLAGLYLYFWIVVLELFIKMGPLYYVDGNLYGTQPNNLPPPPVPMHAVPIIYTQPQPHSYIQTSQQQQIYFQQMQLQQQQK